MYINIALSYELMKVVLSIITLTLYPVYELYYKFTNLYHYIFILHDSNHVFYQYKFVFYMTVIMYSIGANFYFNLLSIYIVGIDKRFSDGCRGRSRILQDTERCNVNNKC